MVTLNELVPGDKVRLVEFGYMDPMFRRQLLALGVTRGVEMSVVRVAPLGCPVQMEVRGTSLMLRKTDAHMLRWDRIV